MEPVAASPAPRPGRRRGRRPSPQLDQLQRTWYFFRRNTLALVGLGILLVFAGVALYAATQPISWTGLTPYCATNHVANNSTDLCVTSPQVCTYPVGTPPPQAGCYQTPTGDPSIIGPTLGGRFVWTSVLPSATLTSGPLPLGSLTLNPSGSSFFNIYDGLLRGSDWSITISLTIVGGGALAGLFLGAISGFFGGVVDEVLMRLVDIFLSIPTILFVIIVVAVVTATPHTILGLAPVDSSVVLLILAFTAVWWPFYARVVRGQALVVREQKYVEAARAAGARGSRIVFRHIVPNSLYPVLIQMSLDVGTVPLFLGFLVYLGFSNIFPSGIYFPEWGAIAALSVTNLTGFLETCQLASGCIVPWWQILFPGLTLFMWAISVNFLSDGLRDALDPRLRR